MAFNDFCFFSPVDEAQKNQTYCGLVGRQTERDEENERERKKEKIRERNRGSE